MIQDELKLRLNSHVLYGIQCWFKKIKIHKKILVTNARKPEWEPAGKIHKAKNHNITRKKIQTIEGKDVKIKVNKKHVRIIDSEQKTSCLLYYLMIAYIF